MDSSSSSARGESTSSSNDSTGDSQGSSSRSRSDNARSSSAGPTSNDNNNNNNNNNNNGGGGSNTSSSNNNNNDGDNGSSSSSSSSSSSNDNNSRTRGSGGGAGGGNGNSSSRSADNTGASSSAAGGGSQGSSEASGPTSSSNGGNGPSSSAASPSSNAGSSSTGGAAGGSGASSSNDSNGTPSSASSSASPSDGAAGGVPTSASSSTAAPNSANITSGAPSTSTNVVVLTINGHPVTSTRTQVFSATLAPGNRKTEDTGYWNDGGAVGGTFAAVGIVAVALLGLATWLFWRRRKTKRMDADVVAAASAAEATTRRPFDDDDDDLMPYDGTTTHPRAPEDGAQPYYNIGYHQPDHMASMVEDPYVHAAAPEHANSAPMAAGATAATAAASGSAHGGESTYAHGSYLPYTYDTASAGMQPHSTGDYAENPSVYSSGDAFRDASNTGYAPVSYAAPAEQPRVSFSSGASEYQPAASEITHETYYAPAISSMPATAQPEEAASEAPLPSLSTDQPEASRLAPPTTTDLAPAYSAGSTHVNVSDSKNPITFTENVSTKTDLPPRPMPTFGEGEAASTQGHGDWDPPALSSAWFPATHTTTEAAPSTQSMVPASRPDSLQPYTEVFNPASDWSHSGVSEAVDAASTPQRLTVRNPSPL